MSKNEKLINNADSCGSEKYSPYFLQEQIRKPKSERSESFNQLIERTIKEEEKDNLPETEKETLNRYLFWLEIAEEELMDKKIIDLGCGDGRFVNYINNNEIGEAWGVDLDYTNIKNFIVQDIREKLPINNADYIFICGVLPFMWDGEKEFNIVNVTKNWLKSLKDDGEIRLYPVTEEAVDNNYSHQNQHFNKIKKLLEEITQEIDIEYQLIPREVVSVNREKDILLRYVLIIKKKQNSTNSNQK